MIYNQIGGFLWECANFDESFIQQDVSVPEISGQSTVGRGGGEIASSLAVTGYEVCKTWGSRVASKSGTGRT